MYFDLFRLTSPVSRAEWFCIKISELILLCADNLSGQNIWTSIEISVAVISACLPTLRPLLQFMRVKLDQFSASFRRPISMQYSTNHSKANHRLRVPRSGTGNFERLSSYPLDGLLRWKANKVPHDDVETGRNRDVK